MIRIRKSCRGIRKGRRIGQWKVMGPAFRTGRKYVVVVECSCGNMSAVKCDDLASKKSQRCLECSFRLRFKNRLTHGDSKGGQNIRLYHIWKAIKARCLNPNEKGYKNYGGRGILICDKWLNDYVPFRDWALSHGYTDDLQIDRIDNAGNYEPRNCRFVTPKENCRNTRTNRLIVAFGETKCLAEWADDSRCKVCRALLRDRLNRGWEPERAIATPPLASVARRT